MLHALKLQPLSMMKHFMAATALFATVSSYALPSDRQQNIELSADKATYNEKSGVMTYSGNVLIQQGTMKLQAQNIVAQLNADKQIQTITAKGNPATFQQQISAQKGLAKGQGQTLVYNAESGIITLTGNALLTQDGASIRGNALRYSMNAGDIEVSGNKDRRVHLVIPPSSNRSFPGVKD